MLNVNILFIIDDFFKVVNKRKNCLRLYVFFIMSLF